MEQQCVNTSTGQVKFLLTLSCLQLFVLTLILAKKVSPFSDGNVRAIVKESGTVLRRSTSYGVDIVLDRILYIENRFTRVDVNVVSRLMRWNRFTNNVMREEVNRINEAVKNEVVCLHSYVK